jgi:hypothetical protein
MSTLHHGGYCQPCPEGIHQHKYAGGGNPGCGGYMEALEIESVRGLIFLLHEYRDDHSGPRGGRVQRYRWRVFDTLADVLEAWKILWTLSGSGEGFVVWTDKPFWEAVDYNAPIHYAK